MPIDIRDAAARYYDYNPNPPADIPFYVDNMPSPDAKVLELGCGTGRVTIPLSQHCHSIQGVDLSEAMIAICREKLDKAGIPPAKASVAIGDITDIDLGRRFDLIIAPFRVFQNLESDEEVDGFFACVRKHLAPQGACILNVFQPNRDPQALRETWCTQVENLSWEVMIEGQRIACYDRRPRMDPEKMVLYPELVYRRYDGDVLVDEAVLKIAMRCYYPQEFSALIRDHGFRILDRWGGYHGEAYGDGPELVVKFGM